MALKQAVPPESLVELGFRAAKSSTAIALSARGACTPHQCNKIHSAKQYSLICLMRLGTKPFMRRIDAEAILQRNGVRGATNRKPQPCWLERDELLAQKEHRGAETASQAGDDVCRMGGETRQRDHRIHRQHAFRLSTSADIRALDHIQPDPPSAAFRSDLRHSGYGSICRGDLSVDLCPD